MAIWPLPRVVFRELSLVEEKRPAALLTDPDVWAEVSAQLTLPILIQAEPTRYDRELFEYLADNLPSQVKVIYAVGQGAPVMAAKMIASRRGVPLVIVPTALDSDWMLTPLARLEDEIEGQTHVVWEETGPATEVIIDWDVIQAAPADQRAGGIVDVLSIVTGLLDWRYAAQRGKNAREQRFESWAAAIAAALAKEAIKDAQAVGEGDPAALMTLLNLMMSAVQLSNQLGHTRAQQGAEHVLAEMIAAEVGDDLSHAAIVGPCLLLVSALHGQSPAALQTALEQAGIPLDGLRPTDVQLVLGNLPNLLGDYNSPYSILNDLDPLAPEVIEALEAAGLALREETWTLTDSQRIEAMLDAVAPATEQPTVQTPAQTPAQAEAIPAAENHEAAVAEAAPNAEAPASPETVSGGAEDVAGNAADDTMGDPASTL